MVYDPLGIIVRRPTVIHTDQKVMLRKHSDGSLSSCPTHKEAHTVHDGGGVIKERFHLSLRRAVGTSVASFLTHRKKHMLIMMEVTEKKISRLFLSNRCAMICALGL